ncbi:two-component system response regulator [Natronococcus pandeyae]|uniref:Two-component system response regulator n=1 Tax=Natronococcus pandeyae TaxID=2055836 RepID=A0A8J8Q1V7_9EURY|nr:response regulator [Natronococcus pandeyae]TYL38600.1 two-component system response regulator [Natronococcus pandeyae]
MNDIDILLVEDNHGDIHLIERAFDTRELPGTVHVVQTGDDALDWLSRHEAFADAPRPDLVLLDLNLPGTSGHTVLEEIKSDPDLRRIPVIILTSSRAEDDLIDAYETHANACLIKPVDPEQFADRIQAFVEFWVSTATLPPSSN